MSTGSLAAACGTYAGVQVHRRRKEPSCSECAEAQRQYMRDYRKRKGPELDRWWNKTRGNALELLAAEYPQRFAEILARVRAEGITPWEPEEAS